MRKRGGGGKWLEGKEVNVGESKGDLELGSGHVVVAFQFRRVHIRT